MSRNYGAERSGTIDQVIQREMSAFEHSNPNSRTSRDDSSDRTNLILPKPLSQTRSSRLKPSSPQQDQLSPLRSNPPVPTSEPNHSPLDRRDKFVDTSKKETSRSEDEGSNSSKRNSDTLTGSSSGSLGNSNNAKLTDFFSPEVFQIVIHNPTTAHRFLKFCQGRACGENMEFLQKVDAFNRALDEVTQILSTIHSTYTSPDAPRQISLQKANIRNLSADIKQGTSILLPELEHLFASSQDQIERLLASDIYPRFVKHQVTTSATSALTKNRERFQGLGDCFCLTDPMRADNPILFASDGFVSVTGYSRKDIIHRNCRFLQGELTDSRATKRLRASIDSCEETVEVILNYRKNGDPFWNLLYVAPLLNEKGEVVMFLGGQINCSTTIRSCNDILKILSVNDEEAEEYKNKPPSVRSLDSRFKGKTRSNFFKSFRKYNVNTLQTAQNQSSHKVNVRDEAGMEPELVNRIGKLTFKTQVEAFYTAYSKYLVLSISPQTQQLTVQHYSPGIIDILSLTLPNGSIAPIFNKDIFRILADNSAPHSTTAKKLQTLVRGALSEGRAMSAEVGLLTGYEERKERMGLGKMLKGENENRGYIRVEEQYVTHWTPLKDAEGRPRWVILTIAPKD